MRARLVALGIGCLVFSGCGADGGGGGGGGGTGALETRRTFVIPHVLEKSGRCVQVAVGDLDGDGVPDLCVHQADLSSVAVLLSTRLRESPTSTGLRPPPFVRGAEAYESGPHVFVWDSARDLAVGDVDRDGRLDLVVAGGDAQSVGVWWGDRKSPGQLLPPTLLRCSGDADRVAVGDLDGDGRPDLVCLDESRGHVTLLRQDAAARTFTVDASPPDIGACFGLVALDLDRDGALDLVTNRPGADVVTVFALDAAAGVLAPRDVASGQATGRAMAVGDVDGDGWVDLCVLAEGGAEVVCLRQRSTQPGTFAPVVSSLGVVLDEEGVSVTVPAVQRRGVVTGCSPGQTTMIDDRGTLVAGISIDEPGVHVAGLSLNQPGLGLADADGDGALDLCATPLGGGDVVFVYGVPGSPGTFRAPARAGLAMATLGRVAAIADLDCDGRCDVVACDPDSSTVNQLYAGNGLEGTNPLYEPRLQTTAPGSTRALVAADLDRDGRPDLVTATSSGIEVRFQETGAPGSFLAPLTLGQGAGAVSVAVGDVNGDGCPDLVACTAGGCAAFLRDPAAPRGFLPPLPFPPAPGGDFRAVRLGDLDGDGHPDCVCVRESPSVASYGRGNGDGTFQPLVELDTGVADPRDCAVADLDGDGDLDVCVCGTDACAVVRQGLFLTWEPPEVLALVGGVRVAAGDVNGDGRCDLCVTSEGGVLVVLARSTAPGFLPSHALSTEACAGLAVGDLNRDGRLDCCFVEVATGTLRCSNADPEDDSPPSVRLDGLPPGVPVEGTFVATGDLDGDGRVDIATACPDLSGAASSLLRTFSPAP